MSVIDVLFKTQCIFEGIQDLTCLLLMFYLNQNAFLMGFYFVITFFSTSNY